MRARHEAEIFTNKRSTLPLAVSRIEDKSAALDVVLEPEKAQPSMAKQHEKEL
jgi:hypothetical protein